MKTSLYYILFATTTILFAAGCHETKKSTSTAQVGLHLHTAIGDSILDPAMLNVYVHDSLGRVEKLSHAQFYITNVSFHSTTTGWYTIPNSLILKREENEEYVVGNVPADNYDDVRFTIGLSSTLNSGSPSSYASTGADSVLSSSENAMYFGSNLGYKFMSVAGIVDTSANNAGMNPIAFSYDLGASGDTAVITMPVQSFTILPGSSVQNVVQFVHIVCDYGYMLQNTDIVHNPAVRNVSTNGTVIQPGSAAAQIWANMLNMFRYECSTPNGNC